MTGGMAVTLAAVSGAGRSITAKMISCRLTIISLLGTKRTIERRENVLNLIYFKHTQCVRLAFSCVIYLL